MKTLLFEFDDYRAYLKYRLTEAKGSRGSVSTLAEYLNCQSSFLSQVISFRSHLSLEHGHKVCDFLQFSQNERDYFLLLIQENRAGTHDLKEYFKLKAKKMQDSLGEIKNFLGNQSELNETQKSIYYSHWWYSAVHVLALLPKFKTVAHIASRLNMSLQQVEFIIQFLVQCQLIKPTVDGFQPLTQSIHLGKDSYLIAKHHVNWRLKMAEILNHPRKEDLNYSSIIGISERDAKKLRTLILKFLAECDTTVMASKEEEAYILNFDFCLLR